MVMHAGWWANVGKHSAWLDHLAGEARADNLLPEEVLLVGARDGDGREFGGKQEAAVAWLAELREIAARAAEGDGRERGELLDRLELLARVAVLARVALAGA